MSEETVPRKPGPAPKPPEQRFWESIDKRGPDDCWEWQLYRANHGYGRINFRNGAGAAWKQYAHRFSYELHNGPIPEGMQVCHSCDNPPCCNPAHLFLGTQADNLKDMRDKGRGIDGEDHVNAKLTEAEARAIKRSTDRNCDLAAKYGVSYSNITMIKQGKRWKHIE